MPELIDTHTHIYLPEFDSDLDDMIQRALQSGVSHMMMPNIDLESVDAMMALAKKNRACKPMMGLHPCSVKNDADDVMLKIHQLLLDKQYQWYGIGECGLDYYWDLTFVDQQKAAFVTQIRWAKEMQLPLIIHSRNATDDCIDLVSKHKDANLRGIFHCFSGTELQLQQSIDLGFYIGIGGVVTYKNGGLDKVLKPEHLPHLVLETDAPYLSPVPFRGKRNEPAYLTYVVNKLAEILGLPVEHVAEVTSENARRVFGVGG